ncbi:cysteine hydrolase family protein [Chloroflexota bacterium]
MKPALIVIDMQEYFRDENPIPFKEKLLPNIKEVLTVVRSSGIPVVHVITRYSQDKSDWPQAWQHLEQIWCLEGTEGVRILEEAKPLEKEPVVTKTRFSGFYDSNLENVIQGLDIDTLFIAGYSSDVCVRMTILDAYNRGYGLFLLTDCVHAAKGDTKDSIQYLRWLTNLEVVVMKGLRSRLEASR